ncbi:MAG TPA: hypothetical protein PKV42_01525 [Thiobacillus sp.]|nr:MAG: hypothetical protein B7Y27_09455 [Hydrogenophilales bacterium 16-64-40]OZA32289.1 MAG: hypothetical protein B7X82_13615 [Hydrogenophilales bacterium 17-64-65]HQS81115.1 hypothetical protein [Thiobacillus sp.]HQT32801.1 hypothetical protein [Thiobacillus sp.]
MTTLDQTAFKQLDADKRLQNPVFKDATGEAGRFGFRGEIAIKFAPQYADEARPPELTADQVIAVAHEGKPGLDFMAAYLLSFEYLKPLADAMGSTLTPEGKYFLFCNNIDLSTRYQVPYRGATFYVLPIDEATVYNELLDLLYLERIDLKRLNSAGKVDKIAETALKFSDTFPTMSYEEGLAVMGPVRNPNENRPV